MNFVEKNDSILQKWKEQIEKFGEDPKKFASDGIMFRGEIDQYFADENERWSNPKKENELWENAPIRYLFLTKDQNAGDDDEAKAWDVRGETGRSNKDSSSIRYLFYRNLMYILYGLINSTDALCGYEDFTNEQAIQTYDSAPLARINVKKQAGGSSIDNKKLKEHIERYKEFLVEQITALDADVLICCGYSESIEDTGNIILNFLNKEIYNFTKINEWIYYDDKTKKVAINAWHLSYRGVKQKDFFEGLVTAYHKFIIEHPDFIKHR